VTAIKSMLGESLGASGALAAVALIEALGDGRLPGVAGLERLDPALPLPGVGAASRRVAIARGLLTALDLDGAVQALVIVAPTVEAGGAGGGGEGQ
jgi:3-oxoacyl-[acyl-carrier-protein] synthase II